MDDEGKRLPTIAVYETEYGRIRLSEGVAEIFRRCGKQRMVEGYNGLRPRLTDPELEAAIMTLARKAHECGVELKEL